MKQIEKLSYQCDVVTTLADNKGYILWVDTEGRMIETENGINKQITSRYEIKKYCRLFGYPEDAVII